jgi:hypothetical protein
MVLGISMNVGGEGENKGAKIGRKYKLLDGLGIQQSALTGVGDEMQGGCEGGRCDDR